MMIDDDHDDSMELKAPYKAKLQLKKAMQANRKHYSVDGAFQHWMS